MTSTDLPTYDAAVAYQQRLVERAMLASSEVHAIAESDETAYGSVWITCTCGQHVSFKVDDSERGQRLYVQHIGFALRARLAVAA